MAINWYPGHMHKANKAMAEVLPQVDVVIEVLDARLPFSSANPVISRLSRDKARLQILNKADLADADLLPQWEAWYQAQGAVTLRLGLDKTHSQRRLLAQIRALAPAKGKVGKVLLAMISGIPNVGKSTLINALVGRQVAKTGNEPAVTKGQQRFKLDGHSYLLDTPGILWPKIHNEQSGYRLAASGAIRATAISSTDVAFFAADFLLRHYPQRLQQRYQLSALPPTAIELLELLGAKRGCLRKGGQIDLEKIANILLTELRDGKLGGLCFETPEQVETEQAELKAQLAATAKQTAERKVPVKRRN